MKKLFPETTLFDGFLEALLRMIESDRKEKKIGKVVTFRSLVGEKN